MKARSRSRAGPQPPPWASATIILMLGLGKRAAKPENQADLLAEALNESA